ncbi:MAG TPA: ABC transporter permease [Planctomycetota bacterium]|nr:ABC transporter permease [Planctomycetota bacterium]
MSAEQGNSYWSVVGRQLRKNRTAMLGFWCVISLLLLAVYAPVLASSRPFYCSGPEGWSLPWFRDLFDRIAVPQPVDLFFNLLLVFLPFAAVAYVLVRRFLLKRGRWKGKAIRRTLGVLAAVLLWIFLGIYLPDGAVAGPTARALLAPGLALRSSKPYVDYHERVKEAAGGSVTAIFPPIPYNFGDTRVRESSLPPDWFFGKRRTDLGAVGPHPLGTDPGGRDVFTALLYGTRISMTIGVIAVGIYVTIGIVLGSLAGYFGGKVDMLISRFIEVMICFPLLFFVLTIVSVFETRTIFLIMAAIGVTAWPGVARLVRGEFLTQRGSDYVTAAEALGIPKRRIIFRHILPNALTPVLVAATFGIASAILTESSLAFLGLGDVNAASWGMLLNMGRHTNFDWLILAPGAAIFFTVTVFNLVGEGLRDALDPKLRQ